MSFYPICLFPHSARSTSSSCNLSSEHFLWCYACYPFRFLPSFFSPPLPIFFSLSLPDDLIIAVVMVLLSIIKHYLFVLKHRLWIFKLCFIWRSLLKCIILSKSSCFFYKFLISFLHLFNLNEFQKLALHQEFVFFLGLFDLKLK